jgi:hypothetical protein
MKPTLFTSFKCVSHNIFRNITATRTRRHVIEKFTNKVGLIYFGSVSQHEDEHRVVRGFTVSATHQDNHYSVGSISGYEITVVDRSDAIPKSDGSIIFNDWLIMTFDLQTKQDLPHIFINANNHDSIAYDSIFKVYPMLSRVNLGTFEDYDSEFISRFTIYAALTDSIEAEKLLSVSATRVLGAHFWPHSAEIHDGVLYVYSDAKNITGNTLDTILAGGLWLAHHIDSQIEQI